MFDCLNVQNFGHVAVTVPTLDQYRNAGLGVVSRKHPRVCFDWTLQANPDGCPIGVSRVTGQQAQGARSIRSSSFYTKEVPAQPQAEFRAGAAGPR